MKRSPTKPGRPVDADGDATRSRVLSVARAAFAELGYGATTYQVLAERAGLSPSALYNYFDSKAELYAAVHEAVQLETYAEWLLPALAEVDTFAGKIDALLSSFVEMNSAAPDVARFQSTARVDTARYPELADVRSGLPTDRRTLFAEIVDLGIANGELAVSARPEALAMLEALSLGLVELSADAGAHRLAVEGFRRALITSFATKSEAST